MALLRIIGDYREVMTASVNEAHVRIAEMDAPSLGLGLGAPSSYGPEDLGEAILLGHLAAFTPSTRPLKADYSSPPFKAAFFLSWAKNNSSGYYLPPSTEWNIFGTLDQMMGELLADSKATGIYGILMSGLLCCLSGRALVKSPISANRPVDGTPINSLSNFPRFLRSSQQGYEMHPFILTGVFFDMARMNLDKGFNLCEPAFGSAVHGTGMQFHAHALVLEKSCKAAISGCSTVDGVLEAAQNCKESILTVEHVLPETRIFEAWSFVTPITSLVEG
ncbi:MAG: hypothetical protein Kow00107_08870 [Planctomycetota bacterium]